MAVLITVYPDAGATGYVSVAYFKAWCDQRLKTYTGKTDDQIAAAIVQASEFMDARFAYPGYRKLKDEVLEYPREEAWDARGDRIEGVPDLFKRACCGYAFRALTKPLMSDPTRDDSGRAVKSQESKVGPIAESVEYETSSGFTFPVYPEVDNLLYRAGLAIRQGSISTGNVARA